MTETINFGTTKDSIVKCYHKHYPMEYYKSYPETCVGKTTLSEDTLMKSLVDMTHEKRMKILQSQIDIKEDEHNISMLPPVEERTRNDVTKWLYDSSLTFDDICGVGW
mgnify:CR=1 FL=1